MGGGPGRGLSISEAGVSGIAAALRDVVGVDGDDAGGGVVAATEGFCSVSAKSASPLLASRAKWWCVIQVIAGTSSCLLTVGMSLAGTPVSL